MVELFRPDQDGWASSAPVTALIGPPGTGKTTAVITSWLTPALAECDPKEILACSFTRAAAGEMRERLTKATELDEWSLRRACSTIHSEAFRLVKLARSGVVVWKESMREPGKKASGRPVGKEDEQEIDDPWDRMAKPCSELRPDSIRVWGLACHKWPLEALDTKRDDLPRLISRALSWTESKFRPDEIAAEIVDYQVNKDSINAIDFTDMLLGAVDLVPDHRQLLLVDEAQDLSPLQILLVERWAEVCDRLVWVGDPDQGIYRFSGADGEHLTGLMRSPDVAVRSLQQSWRVPARAHSMARDLILRNQLRVDAPYHAADKPGSVHEVHGHEAAIRIAEEAAKMGSVFVLARTGRRLGDYAQEMVLAGIPFTNERGPSPMTQRRAVKLVLCAHDILEGRLVGKDQLRAFVDGIPGRPRSSFLLGKKKDSQAAVKDMDDGLHIRSTDLRKLGLDIDEIRACGSLEGVLESMRKLESSRPQLRILARHGEDGLRKEPAITITTMHGSKGREAETVIADLEAPYPVLLTLASGDRADVEAERRVLYVALTRTLDALVLVHALNDLGELLGC